MQASDREWARGYAQQALSDLNAREILRKAGAEKCHRLHFLQMAAEKICKAYLIAVNGRENVKNVHTYVAVILPTITRQFYSMIFSESQIPFWQFKQIKTLAQEIEKLAPAADAGARPDNSEYPWQDAKGEICIPCEYNFPGIDDGSEEKSSRALVILIRLMRTVAEVYAK